MKKINLLMCIITVVSAVSIACGDTGSEGSAGADSGKEAVSREEAKEEKEEEKARDDSEQADKEKEFKQQCQSVDYREYFRNDHKYIGEKIKVEILVDQVIEGDCRGYDLSDNEYYICDLRTGEDKFRIMEGDWITVYGEFAGVQQITRALGDYTSDIFCVDGKYIDLYEGENQDSPELVADEASQDAIRSEEEKLWTKEQEEYIFPDSDIRLLTEDELSALSPAQLRIAKNELYARHGRIFASEDLQQYFGAKSWYSGTIPGEQFSENVFNQTEKDNIALLQWYIDSFGQGNDTGYAQRGLAINYEDAVPQLPGTYCYYDDPADRNGLRMELTIEEDGYTYVGFYAGEHQIQRSIILTNLMNDVMYTDEDGMVSFSCSDYGQIAYYKDLEGNYSGMYTFLP